MTPEQAASLRESIALIRDWAAGWTERLDEWSADVESGKYSKGFMQRGVSKREVLARYEGMKLIADEALKGLEMLIEELDTYENPGGAPTPPGR